MACRERALIDEWLTSARVWRYQSVTNEWPTSCDPEAAY
jgi:hypothetical protein